MNRTEKTPPEIILASASPRRQEMLRNLNIPIRVAIPRTDETPRQSESPEKFAVRAAMEKAHHAAQNIATADDSRRLVVAADTIVVLDNRILGKPENDEHAHAMLKFLSGHTHQVVTGLCVLMLNGVKVLKEKKTFVSTDVTFKELSPSEIDAYVATHEPADKAGAYAIQGIGGFLVKEIKGSYTNVVGLPLCELMEICADEFGCPLV